MAAHFYDKPDRCSKDFNSAECKRVQKSTRGKIGATICTKCGPRLYFVENGISPPKRKEEVIHG